EMEKLLDGKSAGDDFAGTVQFPEGFHIATLAGKSVDVAGKVVRVQESQMPAVDEAFAASFGVKEGGLERFREDVRANLERELKNALMGRLKIGVVEKLVEAHADLELPQGMIDNEARLLARQANAPGAD